MATKTAEKPADLTNSAGVSTEGESGNSPITAVGYDANGEAVDIPVDTRHDTQGGLPGVEEDQPIEMFDGKPVSGWKYSLTGNIAVNQRSRNEAAMFEAMRAGRPVTLLVTVEPGDVRYGQNTEDGHIVGFTRIRKLHVTDVFAADADASELFEGGIVRARKAEDDGNIGFLTQEPPIPDDENPLAASLAEAMPVEPGMCGETHRGHQNPCRQPAHSCPLRGS